MNARVRAAVVAAVVLAGSLGLTLAGGTAAATANESIDACYRTANDIYAASSSGTCPGGFFHVELAASTYDGDLLVCVDPGDPLLRPAGDSCTTGQGELLGLFFGQSGVEACTQPGRSYHAPKQDGSCRPNRELVTLATVGQGGG